MADTADPLVLDFVEWIAREPRLYSQIVSRGQDVRQVAITSE